MNFKRWTEQTKPICPYALKSGDKCCYTQCVHSFEDGINKNGEKLHGCKMADETVLTVWKLKREMEESQVKVKERKV